MHVVCVNDNWTPDISVAHLPHPKIGDRDIVTRQEVEVLTDYTYYRLKGFPGAWYRASHFVPLDDTPLDDTPAEVIEEKETETVTA